MPPKPRNEPPHVQVRVALIRLRTLGVEFDDAWEVAFGAIKWPYDTNQKRQWRTALADAREEFYAAYEGRPSRVCECALALMGALEDREGVDPNDYELRAAA